MYLTIDSNETKIKGDFQTKAYTADEKTIADLSLLVSSKIYTDNVLAVIREISCNAYDANLESNSKKRFIFTFPSHNQAGSPFLKWRDFGPGLSPKEIDDIYTNIMKSTKRDKKHPIGCFGVGSKSPFSYSSSFNVNSFHNGYLHSYTMQKTDKGFSSIKLGEQKTSEPNGLEVIVPIKYSDVSNFISKALNYFSFWDEKDLPEFENLNSTIPNNLKSILKNKKWEIFQNSSNIYDFTVLMGNVLYIVNRQELDLDPVLLNKLEGITVRVPLGYFSPSISRETLDYNNYTKDQFKNLFNELIDSFTRKIKEEINQCKSFFEARSVYLKYKKFDSFFANNKIIFNNLDVRSKGYIHFSLTREIEKILKIPNPTEDPMFYGKAMKMSFSPNGSIKISSSYHINTIYLDSEIPSRTKIRFFIKDHNFKHKTDDTKFYKFLAHKFNLQEIDLYEEEITLLKDRFVDFYGKRIVKFHNISKLYKRLEKEYQNFKSKKSFLKKRKFSGVEIISSISPFKSIKNSEVDLSDGGFYIDMRAGYYNHSKASKVFYFLRLLKKNNKKFSESNLYGFKSAILKSEDFIKNSKKWISYDEIEDFSTPYLLQDDSVFCSLISKVNNFPDINIYEFEPFYKKIKIILKCANKTKKVEEFESCLNFIDLLFKINCNINIYMHSKEKIEKAIEESKDDKKVLYNCFFNIQKNFQFFSLLFEIKKLIDNLSFFYTEEEVSEQLIKLIERQSL